MGYERAAWVGNAALSAVMVFLAWKQVSTQVAHWTTVGIAIVVALSIVALFPRKRADGSTTRLINNFQSNKTVHQKPTMTAGANSNQIVNEGGGTFNINPNKK